MKNWFRAAAPSLARQQAKPGLFLSQLPVAADAPNLPPKVGSPYLANVLPPFGTNPPTGPVSQLTTTNYEDRYVSSDPRDIWFLSLPSKILPKQVDQILRSALGGDVWQQWQLCALMLDSWPMFRKCSHELRAAVANARFKVVPHVDDDGAQPTPEAAAKAALVRKAMRRFKPNPFNDEVGWSGTVYDLADAVLNGLSMGELLWYRNADLEWLPRATAWVHPRHFTFGNDGNICVFDGAYNRLNFMLARQPGTTPDPDKFLLAQFKSRSGSALGAGLMRPLAWYWSAMVYNRDWMLKAAQKFGSPFVHAAYKAGSTADEVAQIEGFLARGIQNGYVAYPEGTTLAVSDVGTTGADNRQSRIVQEANEACQILLLGQTASTTPTPGKLGNDTAHMDVKQEHVQAVARWVATVLSEQFAPAVCRLNYGEGGDDECPTIEADFAQAEDPQAAATRVVALTNAGIPIQQTELYKAVGFTAPQEGDVVFVGGTTGGQTGKMADPEADEVGGKPPPPPLPPGFGKPGGKPGERGNFSGGEDGAGDDDEQALRAALAGATDKDVEDLHSLAVAAVSAPRLNGEVHAVQRKVVELMERLGRRTKGTM